MSPRTTWTCAPRTCCSRRSASYTGTVIFVSHDRYFIDRLATRVLEIENGTITAYEGNYEDYLRRKEALAASSKPTVILSEITAAIESKDLLSTCSPKPVSHRERLTTAANTIVIEGGFESADGAAPKKQTRRLNPIKQKQMEDRCGFLEEEIPRVESSIAHTEEQLGVYVQRGRNPAPDDTRRRTARAAKRD